jgi:transketolase
LDAEVSNSTFAEIFAKQFPERYFEMFIAEQNMVSVASGLSILGFIPFASTFAAFLTRAFDQIRMAQYSQANIKLVGSHSGVSIGQDGPSQMGLEDLALIRSILESKIFYPADAVSAMKLTQIAAQEKGLFYLRTTRAKTPIIYSADEQFKLGGSKIIHQSDQDIVTVFSAGITLHEALKAYENLKKDGISIAVVDLYSVKPLDAETVQQMAQKTKKVIVVEDHYPAGGLGEAVSSILSPGVDFVHLAVKKLPRSGKSEELLNYEEIDAAAIIKTVKGFSSA